MFWFITTSILVLLALLVFIFGPKKQVKVVERNRMSGEAIKTEEIPSMKPFGFVFILIALIVTVACSFTTVGVKSVGVPTSFNRTTGETLSAGAHFTAPWVKVTDIDGSIQAEEYRGEDCITVKIADGGTGCVWVAYRWRINPDNADQVFQDYRNSELEINDAVRAALVSTNMKASINEAFSSFDPLGGTVVTSDMTVDELAELKVNVNPDYADYNEKVETAFNEKIQDVGDQVELISVTISYFALPDSTQKRIDAFNAAVQETKIAIQDIATKEAQADANAELEDSVDNPNVLVSKCLDSLAAGDFTAPAGFNCWPGQGSGVVIPATR